MDKKALVIGINNYPNAPLYACIKDANDFKTLIENNGDGSPNCQVELHTDVPTQAKLNELITEFFKGDTSLAIVYFSGHGCVNEQGGFLVTPDAQQYNVGLPMNTVLEIANKSRCRNRVVILDCCNSGAFGEPRMDRGNNIHIQEGVTVLTASRSDEAAIEIRGHGVFTHLLLGALKGGAANLNGHITPAGIYAYIDQALGEFEQRPVFKANATRFVSLRQVEPQVPAAILRKISNYFPNAEHQYQLDPSFEDTNTVNKPGEPGCPPYATPEHVAIFKNLQKLQSIGLVVPVEATFMYFAAMWSKSCKLTPLGQYYRELAVRNRIY